MTGLLGQIGALVAATPLVYALHRWGWTPSYASAALMGVLLGLAVLVVVRDSPYPDHELDRIKARALARAVRAAWRTPGTRLGLWSHFSAQFGATVFALLWGYPFLVAGQGLSPGTAGTLLMLMTVTTVVTSPLIGGFVTRYPFSRSTLILGIVGAIMAVWAVVLLWPGRAPLPLLVLLVVVTAVGGPGSLVGFDLARTFNPPTRLGSATGIVNVGGFLASLSTVTLIGVVLDHLAPGGPSTYTVDTFRAAMSVQYLVWGLGMVQILRYRRKARQDLRRRDPKGYAALRAGESITP
jgi:sugar phosphate permease